MVTQVTKDRKYSYINEHCWEKVFKSYALKITRAKVLNLNLFRIKYGREATLRPPPPPPPPSKMAEEERSAYMFQKFCHRKRRTRSGALTCFSNFAIEKKRRTRSGALTCFSNFLICCLDVVLICDRRFILHPVPSVCIAIEGM